MIAERGFHEASLQEIASRAGLTTGAVYSNFRNKEDLFLAVIRQVAVPFDFGTETDTPSEQIGACGADGGTRGRSAGVAPAAQAAARVRAAGAGGFEAHERAGDWIFGRIGTDWRGSLPAAAKRRCRSFGLHRSSLRRL